MGLVGLRLLGRGLVLSILMGRWSVLTDPNLLNGMQKPELKGSHPKPPPVP
jgi:hypothetical protein